MSYSDPRSGILTAPADERRQTRAIVSMGITLGSSSIGKRKVELLDISASGCRVESYIEAQPGACLVLTIPGLAPIGCEVRWRSNGALGLRFSSSLHPSVLDRVIVEARRR